MSEKRTCWICSDEEYCPFWICAEQEITERMKQEEEAQIDLFEESEE